MAQADAASLGGAPITAMVTADGVPLKKSLARANRRRKIVAFLLVAYVGGMYLADRNIPSNLAFVRWFQLDGNTYVVADNSGDATFVAGTDAVIALQGLIDLSTSTYAAGNHTLTGGSPEPTVEPTEEPDTTIYGTSRPPCSWRSKPSTATSRPRPRTRREARGSPETMAPVHPGRAPSSRSLGAATGAGLRVEPPERRHGAPALSRGRGVARGRRPPFRALGRRLARVRSRRSASRRGRGRARRLDVGRGLPFGQRAPAELVEAGKVRHIGLSEAAPATIQLRVATRPPGAQVILAGRGTDPAPWAALAMHHGIPPAQAWFAGKMLECACNAALPKKHRTT